MIIPFECPYCKIFGNVTYNIKWEEEFEDELTLAISWEWHELVLKNKEFKKMFQKYLNIPISYDDEKNYQKVKIKCKDGCIQIERIK